MVCEVMLTWRQGMEKTIITEGSGWDKPKDGYEVYVSMKGKFSRVLEDGSEEDEVLFDQTEGDETRKYVLGSNVPCKGLEAAILQMKKGEKVIPSLFQVQDHSHLFLRHLLSCNQKLHLETKVFLTRVFLRKLVSRMRSNSKVGTRSKK